MMPFCLFQSTWNCIKKLTVLQIPVIAVALEQYSLMEKYIS